MGLLNFLSSKKNFFALDIGSRFIKVAEFSATEDQLVLTNFQMEECPPQALDRGNVVEQELLSKALSNLFKKKIKIDPKSEIMQAIGGSSVITGTLSVPHSEHANVKSENIKLEVSQYLPVDLSEVHYTCMSLPRYKGDPENEESIFLIAIKKEALSNFNVAMNKISIKTDVDYPAVLALGNSFVANHKKEIKPQQFNVILDIGFRNLSFCVMREDHLVFSRELIIGAENYLVEIQNELGLSYKEAQNLLDTACKNDSIPDQVIHIIQNYNSLCCKEVAVGIEYFLNYFPKSSITAMYVTGGGKEIPQIKTALSKTSGLPVYDLQTFRSIKTKGFTKERIKELRPFLGVCVGLAQTKLVKKK